MEKQVDILIVGAGISGIGVAAHLSKNSPQRSFEIIERRASFGGTWDLFKSVSYTHLDVYKRQM